MPRYLLWSYLQIYIVYDLLVARFKQKSKDQDIKGKLKEKVHQPKLMNKSINPNTQ